MGEALCPPGGEANGHVHVSPQRYCWLGCSADPPSPHE